LKKTPFLLSLVRKSAGALKIARYALDSGENDSAVSRSYYAMFDMARAVLLRAVLTEDKLPRTHNGVIEVFRQYAIESERFDVQLATQLSRAESLRMIADYAGTEIDVTEATSTVQVAEIFLRTLEREFGLDEASVANEYAKPASKGHDGVSEPTRVPLRLDPIDPNHLEELRRQARENWRQLQLQRQRAGAANESGYKH